MNQADLNLMQEALAQLQTGHFREAAVTLARLSPTAQQHPDALYLAALVSDGLGMTADGEALFRAAIGEQPANPGYWNSFALFLLRHGRDGEAIAALEQAITSAPGHGEAWLNLALLQLEQDALGKATIALSRAEALLGDSPRVLAAQGALAQAQGNGSKARVYLAKALALDPTDISSRVRLAKALGQQQDHDAALAELGSADHPELATARADLLADAGRAEEAVTAYQNVISRWPEHYEALTSLAFLLPQLGAGDVALDGFREVLSRDAPAPVWSAALAAARGLNDGTALLDWANGAEQRFGAAPEWRLARLIALRLQGRFADALHDVRLAQDRWPANAAMANHRAWLALRLGALDEAETAALAASQLVPLEQTSWGLLSIIWRLTNDPRESWLLDYDKMVMTADLVVPTGWSSRTAFLADLTAVLNQRHVTLRAPPEQTLRGGTQTRGELFATTHPVLIALRDALRETVHYGLAGLMSQPGHPFFGRLTGQCRLTGSWSVRLQDQGFHVNHIHPQGWLSSAFYIALPPEVDGFSSAGTLTFGVPDGGLELDLAPRRVVVPQVGMLAIFPSYAWHGTVPFESTSPRLTVAFDALPV